MSEVSARCYCAFCRSERVVYRKRHVSLVDVALALAGAFLTSFIIWQDFDPRLVMFFVTYVGFAEIFIVFRWRLSISCPHCGFDPVVYCKNPEQAATRVKAHYARRREEPSFVLSPPPSLPVLRKSSDKAKPKLRQPSL
jgi:hypothetical protein